MPRLTPRCSNGSSGLGPDDSIVVYILFGRREFGSFQAFFLDRIASLQLLLNQTVLTVRLPALLFGMVREAIEIRLSCLAEVRED